MLRYTTALELRPYSLKLYEMILVLNFTISCNLLLLALSNYYLDIILFKITTLFNVSDAASRVLVNDPLTVVYYLFWTNQWHLPLFYCSILLMFNIGSACNFRRLPLVLLVFVVLFSLANEFFYFYLNDLPVAIDVKSSNTNDLLTNTINKYHPALLYAASVALFTGVFNSRFRNTGSPIHTVSLIFTLSLGSWWALQEGSWGGWWNWDPSETFGLFVLLCLLLKQHRGYRHTNAYQQCQHNLYLLVSCLLLFLLLQLGFSLTSHDFGSSEGSLINKSLTLKMLHLLLSWLMVVWLLRAYYTSVVSTKLVSRFVIPRLFEILQPLLLVCLSLLLLFSFRIILDDVSHKLFGFSIFRSNYSFLLLLELLLLSTLLRVWVTSALVSAAAFCLLIYSSHHLTLPVVISFGSYLLGLAHILILVSLLITLEYQTLSDLSWSHLNNRTLVNLPSYEASYNFSLLNEVLDLTRLSVTGLSKPFFSYNLSAGSVFPKLHNFSLIGLEDSLTQTLLVGTYLSVVAVDVKETSLLPLLAAVFVLLSYFSCHLKKSFVITS